jgi:hypothetical protein
MIATCLVANEFVLSKTVGPSNLVATKKSAKKIKELIFEKISKIFKDLLVGNQLEISLRASLQDDLEAGLDGDDQVAINSSSKAKRQAYLQILQEIEEELGQYNKLLQAKLNRLEKLKLVELKAVTLEGS